MPPYRIGRPLFRRREAEELHIINLTDDEAYWNAVMAAEADAERQRQEEPPRSSISLEQISFDN